LDQLFPVMLGIAISQGQYEAWAPRRVEKFRQAVQVRLDKFNVPDDEDKLAEWLESTPEEVRLELASELSFLHKVFRLQFLRSTKSIQKLFGREPPKRPRCYHPVEKLKFLYSDRSYALCNGCDNRVHKVGGRWKKG